MYILLTDRYAIIRNITAFKAQLLQHIQDTIGIPKFLEKTGFPKNFVNTFFNNTKIPHYDTLLKIRFALNLSGLEIPG